MISEASIIHYFPSGATYWVVHKQEKKGRQEYFIKWSEIIS